MTCTRPIIDMLWGEEYSARLAPYIEQVATAHAQMLLESHIEEAPLAPTDINDTATHLLLRSDLRLLGEALERIFNCLMQLSEKYAATAMPGSTSFGHWFAARAELLADDAELLACAYRMANQNPLGAGNGLGYPTPLNRELITRLLGFRTLYYNTLAASQSLNKTLQATLCAISAVKESLCALASELFDRKGRFELPQGSTRPDFNNSSIPQLIVQIADLCSQMTSLQVNRQLDLTHNAPFHYLHLGTTGHPALNQIKFKMSTALETLLYS